MLKRNVVMAKANEIQGEFIIDSEARTKKGTGGVRNVRWSHSRRMRFSPTCESSARLPRDAPDDSHCS